MHVEQQRMNLLDEQPRPVFVSTPEFSRDGMKVDNSAVRVLDRCILGIGRRHAAFICGRPMALWVTTDEELSLCRTPPLFTYKQTNPALGR